MLEKLKKLKLFLKLQWSKITHNQFIAFGVSLWGLIILLFIMCENKFFIYLGVWMLLSMMYALYLKLINGDREG